MKKFIRSSHIPEEINIGLLGFGLGVILVLGAIRNDYPFCKVAVGGFNIIFFAVISIKLIRKSGLYINDDLIYFKRIRKKKIVPQEIAAIEISPAWRRGGKYMKDFPLTDLNGNPLYSMLFFNEYIPWRMQSKYLKDFQGNELNDLHLRTEFSEYTLCYAKYDQSVIDYLLTLNPNIIVF